MNLWYVERFPWHVAFTAVPISFFYFFAQPASLYCEECVYIHIFDCVETVYKLPHQIILQVKHIYTNREWCKGLIR